MEGTASGEGFGDGFDDRMRWLNEPPAWSVAEDGTLAVTTGEKTDFWRETFYGFIRDDGHFYHREVTGDFTAYVTLAGDYETLYDQGGLMVRADERTWLKAGVEYTDGVAHVSAVLTRGHSDWSVLPAPDAADRVSLRVTRHGDAVRVQYLRADGGWQLLRLGHLPLPAACRVGVMCCSPQRAGFTARFTDFRVTGPISRELHD
jgi:regulation of enolase protein 1 (concanavalin A-like superfamily)